MSENIQQLPGQKIQFKDEIWLIRLRKHPTSSKPPLFCIHPQEKIPKKRYRSSLYPTTNQNVYELEYKRIYYKFNVNTFKLSHSDKESYHIARRIWKDKYVDYEVDELQKSAKIGI